MRTSSGTPPQNGCVLTSSRPASKSKPSRRDHALAQLALRRHRERPLRLRPPSRAPACRSPGWISPGSQLPHVAEHARRPGLRRHAGLEAVHQRVVARQARSAATAASASSRAIASTSRKFAEEAGPVVGRALRAPRVLAARRWPASARCTSDSGSALDWRHSRRISRRLARCGSRQRLLLGARRAARASCGVGAHAVQQRAPSRPSPRRAPRCRAAACWRPGPSTRSTAGAGSGTGA